MNKKRIIEIIVLVVILSISLITTKALYKSKGDGQVSVSIASPKIRVINETTNVEVLDLETYSNDFKVVNYDENGNVTEVGLDYKLSFDITDEDAPIDMKLYRIENDGSETEIALNKNLESASENFKANEKSERKYRLKMWFNLDTGHMDENVEINVNLNSTQVKPVN